MNVTTQPALTGLDLGDNRKLRIVRDGEPNTIWAFGRQRKLFFITGHARSGTTWLGRVLMRHPRIHCDGEFHFEHLRQGFDRFQKHSWHRAQREPVRTAAESCFQDTVRLCLGACARPKPEATWIGDRTPRPLEVLLPGAPHITIIRDGRDVTVSVAIMEMNQGGGLFRDLQADPLLRRTRAKFLEDANHFKQHPHELLVSEPFVRAIASRWAVQAIDDVRMGEAIDAGVYEATTAQFVSYEKLHAETDAERERLYRFLDLDPEEAEPLTVESGSLPGLKAENHRSDKRKGVVGDWMNYFTDDAKRWFKEEAGEALVMLGYESDDTW